MPKRSNSACAAVRNAVYVLIRTAGRELPGAQIPMYCRPDFSLIGRSTEKKLSSTSIPEGGKTEILRINTLRTWSSARRTVAVEATTFGRTLMSPSIQLLSSSTAVSYRPTIVPNGPLMRWNSSWMIRSGGLIGRIGFTLAAGCKPFARCPVTQSWPGQSKPWRPHS